MDRISRQIEEASRRRNQESELVPSADSGKNGDLSVSGAASPVLLHASPTRAISLESIELRANRIIDGGQERGAESYRLLRTRVLQKMRQNNWQTLGVTSPNQKAGKTTTAINLSLAVARDPANRVALLDCDFRRPSVHKILGIEPEFGLIEFLAGDVEISDILYSGKTGNWLLFPCGAREHEAPSELLSSERMRSLLAQIGRDGKNNIAIIDLPPVLIGDDVISVASNLDALLIIVEDGVTQEADLRSAMELLQGVEIAGFVLNKSDAEDSRQTYGYYE